MFVCLCIVVDECVKVCECFFYGVYCVVVLVWMGGVVIVCVWKFVGYVIE